MESLILNRNTLYDGGMQQLASGVFERFQMLENTNRNITKLKMPLKELGLSDTKFTDNVSIRAFIHKGI